MSRLGGLEQLIAEGGVDLPTKEEDFMDIEPLPPTPGVPPASELLARLRSDERSAHEAGDEGGA
jgi:hypothetical protein